MVDPPPIWAGFFFRDGIILFQCAHAITHRSFHHVGRLGRGGKKENKASVTFHIETEASDNPKMIFPQLTNGQKRFYRRTPDISLKDVVSFSPFPADFGDYGIVLKLKGSASNRLAALTNMNQGRWMISQINGRVVDGVNIDKQVDDGRLVIWKGVTLEDIAVLDQELPRMGEEGKKKKKK
jgi:hypothetical protein